MRAASCNINFTSGGTLFFDVLFFPQFTRAVLEIEINSLTLVHDWTNKITDMITDR